MSCLRGNPPEQFLGGGVVATSPCYPAEGDGNAALLPGGAVETHGPGTMG